jgi:hypothetical protein
MTQARGGAVPLRERLHERRQLHPRAFRLQWGCLAGSAALWVAVLARLLR